MACGENARTTASETSASIHALYRSRIRSYASATTSRTRWGISWNRPRDTVRMNTNRCRSHGRPSIAAIRAEPLH
jgi:hypothetical protein